MTWNAKFISPDTENGAPLLRREVPLDGGHGPVAQATLVISALGVVDAYLNGTLVSEDLLTPGWTSYEWRLRYAEHDVTALLAGPVVTLGLALGNGWYRGRLGWTGGSAFYGTELAAFAELTIRFADGHNQTVSTDVDGQWRTADSGTTANDLYDGQSIDARAVPVGWAENGFDDSAWSAQLHEVDRDLTTLEPYLGPPVRPQGERPVERVWRSPSGRVLVDFGQNLVGWVRLTASGTAGSTVTLRHAEVLEDGEIGMRPLRSALATDTFVFSGADDVFEPRLTFHGFRYVEVDGWAGAIESLRQALVAVVISSDLKRIGRFESSNGTLNRFHENVVWGMRGNFVDVPTDCPQRDERLGWTGDLSAFATTAVFLFDSSDFLRDWLRDLALEQAHGTVGVPAVVPDVLKYIDMPGLPPLDTAALWSDAAAWVPWAVWEAYGEKTVLSEAYPSMSTHARRVATRLSPDDVWDQDMQFGDWLDPDAPADQPWAAKADAGVVATACAYRTADILARTATILGRPDDLVEFEALAARLRSGFRTKYVSAERIHSDCTTVYALSIVFGLLDTDELPWAGERLAQLVAESGFHISTGFAGTPYLTDALSLTGHVEEAYRLLLQTECPSWLYPVTMGATTVWERWDSMLPDGSINPGEMTSFNHYAFGAVADWMHRVVGGIAPLAPGYSRILIAPRPGGDLDWAATSLDTPHGTVSVRWELTPGALEVTVEIPPGTTAVVDLPGLPTREIVGGQHTFSSPLDAGVATGAALA